MQVKKVLRQISPQRISDLERRVADLEEDLAASRRHNMRLAELVDVVQELLIPLSSRDEEAAAEAIERFRKSL